MMQQTRILVFAALTTVVAIGTGAYAASEVRQAREQREAAPAVATAGSAELGSGPRIVFRHTGQDENYGLVAQVALDDPDGPRAFTDVACDRVAAWVGGASCLVTERGVVSRFKAEEIGPDWRVRHSKPLAGVPSRTRVSPDGSLVATTSFVSGHSYMTTGFSTVTEVHSVGSGPDWGDLEDFTVVLAGKQVSPADRNIWGVTFVDDETFYATVATGGETWLVKGSLAARTLTSITADAECPAVSPDGAKVAFKVDVDTGGASVWEVAVLDLVTMERTFLGRSTRGLDDQVEWLNDDTLLYGLTRADEPGVTDVWAVGTTTDAQPRLLIEEAWSPSVVR